MSKLSFHDFPESLAGLRDGLRAGTFSSAELTRCYLDRIAALDPQLNSFVTVCEDVAETQARAADARIAGGDAGPLTGIPYAHKDIFCTRGIRTSCASRMLDNFIAPYDATVTERLRDAGMVLLGKTNMDEFAMGSSNENSYYGAVSNPWRLECVPGGSSGGSAAAVAAGLAPVATGTDTGGSIRLPAAFCGISGLKPTYGAVSRYGMIAFASSLDQGGPMARSAADLALMLSAMAGFDPRDSTSLDRAPDDYPAAIGSSIDGLTLGIPEEYFSADLDGATAACIESAIRELEQLGANTVSVSLPNTRLAIPAYYVIAPAECSSNLSRYDGVRFGYRCDAPTSLDDLYERSRSEGFGAEVKRRILVGTYALSSGYYDAYYLKAQRARRLIQQDFLNAFGEVDAIVSPTTPSPAFTKGSFDDDPVAMYLADIYTTAVNLSGLPAISVPAGFVDGLPVGLQLIGRPFDEARLLALGDAFQRATDWHLQKPELVQAGTTS